MSLPLTFALVGLLIGQTHPLASPTPPVPSAPHPEASAHSAPAIAPNAELATLMAEGDAHFSRRSVGAKDDVADPHEVEAALTFYRKAQALAPKDMEVLAVLLRALHFKGAYTGADIEKKKVIFEEGRKLGQDAVDRLEADAKAKKGVSRSESLRLVKGTPSLYLWTAGHWGEWALVRGKMAAARSGIAGKLRDLSQTVIDLDPVFEDAAGYRLLGRLHAEAPRIPFITGWVSHDKGVVMLRRAYAANPKHPVTLFFLGEAILEHEEQKKAEGLRMLEECANLTPRPDTYLEDLRYSHMAKKKLAELKAGS